MSDTLPAQDESTVQRSLASFSMVLPPQVSSVAVARAALGGLDSWVTRARLQRLELITSEAVTNAIRHGSPGPDDVLRFDVRTDALETVASVLDCGEPFTVSPERPRSGQIGGFGLFIIEDLSSWWTVSHTGAGNLVTFAV